MSTGNKQIFIYRDGKFKVDRIAFPPGREGVYREHEILGSALMGKDPNKVSAKSDIIEHYFWLEVSDINGYDIYKEVS